MVHHRILWLLCIALLFSLSVCSDSARQHAGPVINQEETILSAYHELGRRVNIATRVQLGDAAQLEAHLSSARHFLSSVEQVNFFLLTKVEPYSTIFQNRNVIGRADYNTIREGVVAMLEALEEAVQRSDTIPSEAQSIQVCCYSLLCEPFTLINTLKQTSYYIRTGRRGRPRLHIEPDILQPSLEYRGPTALAPVFDCSSRTVRRRALEAGFVEPCPPVYIEYDNEETGHRVRLYRHSASSISTLSDEDLDAVLQQILNIYPAFGRRMITGHLRHSGHNVPRERIRMSYERVMGAPAALTSRPLARRVYRVAGPNALWHHDGQHGEKSCCLFYEWC